MQHILTIGHSTHPIDRFIGLLAGHGVTAVCDVRSTPYSRMNPQFNRENLKTSLFEHGITYLFLGAELGARSNDPSCYEKGKVQYDRLAQTGLFKQGLQRVRDGIDKGFRIALMCSEKEPLECHRTILVARHLVNLDIDIQHIHADGRLESHADAMLRLSSANSTQNDFFRSLEDVQADAYRRQENRIAYETEAPRVLRASASESPAG